MIPSMLEIVNFLLGFAVFILFGAIALRHSASISALNERARLAEQWLQRLQDWRDNVRQGGNP